MGIKLNPFTGKLDLVGSGSGGSSDPSFGLVTAPGTGFATATIPTDTLNFVSLDQFFGIEMAGKSIGIYTDLPALSDYSGDISTPASDYFLIHSWDSGSPRKQDLAGMSDLLGISPSFSYNLIAASEDITIPTGQQMLVYNDITIDGILNIDGELIVSTF